MSPSFRTADALIQTLQSAGAVRYGLSFLVGVGNDARWNAEYQIQLRDNGPERLIGCEP